MRLQTHSSDLGACRSTATAFGILAGLGGITHGVGEVLQGNVPVTGIALDSWTTGPIAEHMGGEPGLTVLPTALSAGVATLVVSTAVVGWSIAGRRREHGGSVLSLLSFGMLLAGGGVGPPVIGMLAGAIGRWSRDRKPRWLRRSTPRRVETLGRVWPALFTVSLANATFLVVGSVVLVYTVDLHAPTVFEGSFYLTVLLLLAHLLTAPAYDASRRPGADGATSATGASREVDKRQRTAQTAAPVLAGPRAEE